MSVTAAALVLAWVCLALLAFAMSGLLHQLRDVQVALSRQHFLGPSAGRELPDAARPQGGRRYAALLLVEEHCPICVEVTPLFVEVAVAGPDDIDFVVLTSSDGEKWQSLDGVRHLADPVAYHLLDPGWRPAIVLVDRKGQVVAAEPASSGDSVRTVIDDIVAVR